MKHFLVPLVALALLGGCKAEVTNLKPPLTQFYFPSGIAHVDAPGSDAGVLFVANANANKWYEGGSVVAVPLDQLALPALGTATEVQELESFTLAESQSVRIASFAGKLALQPFGTDRYRLYVPTRSEGMRVYRVEARIEGGVPSLSCVGAEGLDCLSTGVSLSPTAFERSDAGVPRAPAPFAAAAAPRACVDSTQCCTAGADCSRTCSAGQCLDADGNPFADVWVTHQTQADSPLRSTLNGRGYFVRLDSDSFSVDEQSFINAGPGGFDSIVAAGNWVFASGYWSGTVLPTLVNLVRIANRDGVVVSSGLESVFRVSDARDLALSTDGKRLYLLGVTPDTLATFSVTDTGGVPSLALLRSVPVPDGPVGLVVIPRPGRGDLVVFSSRLANSVSVYDEDVGDVVTHIQAVGLQPGTLTVDLRGGGARVFVSLFADGRIGVIDIPDVNRPQDARLVARIGPTQFCQSVGSNSPGCVSSQPEAAQ